MFNPQEALVGATPSCQLSAYYKGQKQLEFKWGEEFKYYDLASLTKIIITTPAMMMAYDRKLFKLDDLVSKYLDWFPFKDVKIQDLLNHTSGLIAWSPFYLKMREQPWEDLKAQIKVLNKENHETSIYSDVGFLTLAFLLEKLYEESFLSVAQEICQVLKYPVSLRYHIQNKTSNSVDYYAPTEVCPWRAKMIQGEVHDENAWTLGGVSSHAGVFGSLEDVLQYGLVLRDIYQGRYSNIIHEKTLKLFTQKSTNKGDWGLGFMLPTPGKASCGKYFSPQSFGHTGFTGTSVWFDPVNDYLVVILSNRTLLGRDKKTFTELRAPLHNWVIEKIKKGEA